MKKVRAQQTSFAMGELSPSTAANQEAQWFSQGCMKMQNYIPLQSGAVMRRPGTFSFIIEGENKRLQHFVSTSGQNLIVAIGETDIRVYAPGSGPLIENGVPVIFPSYYKEIDIMDLAISQITDRLYICSNNYETRYIEISSDATGIFLAEFKTNVFDPLVAYAVDSVVSYDGYDYICTTATTAGDLPTAVEREWQKVWDGGGLRGEGRANSLWDNYWESWPFELIWDDSKIIAYADNSSRNVLWPGSFVLWNGDVWKLLKEDYYYTAGEPPLIMDDCPGAPTYPGLPTFDVCSIFYDIYKRDHRWVRYIELPEGHIPTQIDLWTSASHAPDDYVYTESGLYRCLISTNLKPNKDIPDSAGEWKLIGPSAENLNTDFPSSMLWHNSRAFAVGNKEHPTTIWGSKVNDMDDFALGVLDTDGIEFQISGTNGDPLVCGNGDTNLIISSSQAEMHITGSQGYVTPSDIIVKKETSVGASRVGMFESGASLLFVQRSGNRIFQTLYSNERQSNYVADLSVLAEHLFKESKIKQVAVQRTPEPLIWAVLENGTLLSGTHYVNTAQIAWAKHETQGLITSVCVIPAREREDQVYFTVKREDADGVYFSVEYMDLWDGMTGTDMTQSFDSFNLSNGAIERLEGQEVQAMANDGRIGDQVVTDGSVTIDPDGLILGKAIPVVKIGLGYDSILVPQTIEPFRTRNNAATRVSSVGIKMYQSAGIEVGVYDFDKLNYRKTNSIMGLATSPFSGEKSITVNSAFTDEQWMAIAQFGPFRGRVLGVFYELSVGGE